MGGVRISPKSTGIHSSIVAEYEGCDTSSYALAEINWKSLQLEITEIWREIRNQDPVEIRKSARNHKKS